MTAMSWLALPGQCGIGGDFFAVVREPDGRVWTVNGSGFGPDGASAEGYLERGLTAVPLTGPQAVAAPGAIGALATLHAAGRHPRRSPSSGRPAAAARPRPGCRARRRTAATSPSTPTRSPATRTWPVAAARRPRPRGRRPAVLAELADSIELLARRPARRSTAATSRERAVALLRAGGAPFSGDEWVLGGDVPAEDAISAPYGDVTIHQTPPPSPGWMLLQQAGLLDGLLTGLPTSGAESVHLLALAARRAFRDRYERCALATTTPGATLLAAAELARARREIAARAAGRRRADRDRRRHDQLRRRGRRRARGQRDLLAGLHVRRADLDPGHRHRAQQPARPAAPT